MLGVCKEQTNQTNAFLRLAVEPFVIVSKGRSYLHS